MGITLLFSFASLFFSRLFVRPPQTTILPFCLFLGMVLITATPQLSRANPVSWFTLLLAFPQLLSNHHGVGVEVTASLDPSFGSSHSHLEDRNYWWLWHFLLINMVGDIFISQWLSLSPFFQSSSKVSAGLSLSILGLCWEDWFFFSFIFINWRLITLQYCSGFCHTLTWISHGFTCIPHPDPPSHLPLYPIPKTD